MDVEWAVHDGRPFVLQARPVTGTAGRRPVTEVWNDSLLGDYLWTSANLGEAVPSVMTPLTWSLVQIFMDNAMAAIGLGFPGHGNIGGRFYMNLSATETVGRALGIEKSVDAAHREVFGRLPGQVEIPVIPLSRGGADEAAAADGHAERQHAGAGRPGGGRIPPDGRAPGDRARRRAATVDDAGRLAAFWRAEGLGPYLVGSSRVLRGAGRRGGARLLTLRRDLRPLVGDADTEILTSGLSAGTQGLASMETLVGLRKVALGELDEETYVSRYGHRCADEFEVSVPRPAEDPGWLARQLGAAAETDVDALLARQERTRAGVWERLEDRSPRKARAIRGKLDRWAVTHGTGSAPGPR